MQEREFYAWGGGLAGRGKEDVGRVRRRFCMERVPKKENEGKKIYPGYPLFFFLEGEESWQN